MISTRSCLELEACDSQCGDEHLWGRCLVSCFAQSSYLTGIVFVEMRPHPVKLFTLTATANKSNWKPLVGAAVSESK